MSALIGSETDIGTWVGSIHGLGWIRLGWVGSNFFETGWVGLSDTVTGFNDCAR